MFSKATRVSSLAQGLLYIVPVLLKEVLKEEDEEGFFSWGLEVARGALRRGGFDEDVA